MIDAKIFYNNNILNKNKLREDWVKKNIEEYPLIKSFYKEDIDIKFSQKLYNYINCIKTLPKCLLCDNYKRFMGFDVGYNDFCSKKCARKNSKEKEIETRRKNTLDKYGVSHTSKLESVKKKQKETNLIKYGFISPILDDIVNQKRRETMIKKYGFEYSGQSDVLLSKSLKTRKDKYDRHIRNLYKDLSIISIPTEGVLNIICNDCNNTYEINTSLLRLRFFRYKVKPCLHCNPIKSYTGQTEIYDFLKDNNIQFIKNDRSILNGKEIDIYIPEKKIAIEFNGIYWHSTLFKENNYHINKKVNCENLGIRLIHIWEDEWIYKKDIVISMLKNILHINKTKIMARKCNVKLIDSKLSNDFLEKNHLQGKINSSINIGLYYNNELLSVMTFGKYRRSTGKKSIENEWELYRFCSKLDTNIVGGFSKLFKFFLKEKNPNKIVTYTKRDWSGYKSNDKSVYNNYFIFDGETVPNYWYFDTKLVRSHRFKFRKSKLNINTNEQEYMIDNGYHIAYDSGSFRFVYNKQI